MGKKPELHRACHEADDPPDHLTDGLRADLLLEQKRSLEQLNTWFEVALNNMVQDPSLIHEQLAYMLFRDAGVPAPRSGYARVFVNGELYGLYATIEVIDYSEFLGQWYGYVEGNLYVSAGLNAPRGTSETLDTRAGVHVISPQGRLLRHIPIPEDVITNNGFGGPDMKTLYVTAGKTLFRVRVEVEGLPR